MIRAHLEEDVELIRKYFPGAKAVSLRTPFDISDKPVRSLQGGLPDTFRDDEPSGHFRGDLQWSR